MKKEIDIVRYNPNFKEGLSSEQVKERNKQGLVNKIVKRVTKSYFKIFYENVVNAWNILLFAIAALMIYAKIEIINYAFLVVLVINIFVGLEVACTMYAFFALFRKGGLS